MARGQFRARSRDRSWVGHALTVGGILSGSASAVPANTSRVVTVTFPDATAPFEGTSRTLMRMRGIVGMSLVGATTAGDCQGACGLIVVDRSNPPEAADTGQGPIANPGAPWLWIGYTASPSVGDGPLRGDTVNRSESLVIDSKAQRILKASETLAFVFEVTNGSVGSQNIAHGVSGIMRVLILE